MQSLEVSGAVRLIYRSLGVNLLNIINRFSKNSKISNFVKISLVGDVLFLMAD